jgi:hypothetical protein
LLHIICIVINTVDLCIIILFMYRYLLQRVQRLSINIDMCVAGRHGHI